MIQLVGEGAETGGEPGVGPGEESEDRAEQQQPVILGAEGYEHGGPIG